jgi:hypothetical protein
MSDHPPEQTTTPPAKSEPTYELAWLLLLVAAISIIASVLAATLYARMMHPAPPIKVGVVDIQRLTHALVAGQPEGAASLTRFTEATRSLIEAEPGLILLVKEAVVGTGRTDDYTDALISTLRSLPPPDRPRN